MIYSKNSDWFLQINVHLVFLYCHFQNESEITIMLNIIIKYVVFCPVIFKINHCCFEHNY